jgi:hypothetical protein
MAQDTQIHVEEHRLLAISEECIAQQRAAADQLLHPSHSLLYPEYIRLANAFRSIRIECKRKWLAFRAYQQKMRDDRRNNAAAIQAHSLSIAATLQVHAQPNKASGPRQVVDAVTGLPARIVAFKSGRS